MYVQQLPVSYNTVVCECGVLCMHTVCTCMYFQHVAYTYVLHPVWQFVRTCVHSTVILYTYSMYYVHTCTYT